MASNLEGLNKVSKAAAKGATAKAGATTTTPNAGAGASTGAKSSAKPANGGGPATAAKPAASTSPSSKAGAATTYPIRNDPTIRPTPDWEALRAKVAENHPKVKGEVLTGDPIALLKFLRARQNEQIPATYAAYPNRSVGRVVRRNNGTASVPK